MTTIGASTRTGRALRPYVVLAVLAGSATAIASRFAFPNGTLDLDEVSYGAQANALRAHHLTFARATFDPFFRPFLTGVRGDRVVFKYQPVWPALLAASDAVFHSTLPLRMLMSAAGVLAVTWFARELVGDRRVSIMAGGLALASPFTWVQSASLLGYQLSFVLVTAAGAALLQSLRTRSRIAAAGAGALLGLAVLHRPFDAVLAAVPVLAYAGARAGRERVPVRLAGFVGLGAAPFAIMFLAYNRAVMGSPLRLPFGVTGAADRFGFGWRASFTVPGGSHDGQIHYTVGLAFSTLGRVIASFPRFLVAAPVVLVLAGAVVWLRRRDARVWLLVAMVCVPIVGYLFWWGTANEFEFGLQGALGPFYHYLLLPPVCIAAAWGASVWQPSRRVWFGLVGVAVVWITVFSVVVWRDARSMGRVRTADVASTRAPGRHLTFEAPAFPGDPYLRFVNDARLRGASLAAVDIPGRRLDVVDRFPGRTFYAARSFHRAGDPFGPVVRDRVRLASVSGTSVRLQLHASVPRGFAATSYLRIGRSRRLARGGTNRVDQTWTIDRSDLERSLAAGARPGSTVSVTVGITVDGGSVPPPVMTPDFYESRFEARVVGSKVEILTPGDGFRGYLFPNDAQAVVAEDIAPVVRVDTRATTH